MSKYTCSECAKPVLMLGQLMVRSCGHSNSSIVLAMVATVYGIGKF
jgi:hypothetical protein